MALSSLDPPIAETPSLADEIARLAAQIDAATHRLLVCIRQFDEAEEWEAQGAQSCAHWLAWRIGLDLATAREKVRVARALVQLPAIDAALARTELSYAKTRALTRVATPENEQRLLEVARETTGAQLERICRRFRSAQRELDEIPIADDRRGVRVQPLGGTLTRLELTLHPDEAALVLQAIEKARDGLRSSRGARPMSRDVSAEAGSSSRDVSAEMPPPASRPPLPTRADAVVHIAEQFLALSSKDPETPASTPARANSHYQVFVHLDQNLVATDSRLDAFLDDGTRVSAETFRRVTCDSALVGVATDSDAAPLNIGRRTRAIPPAIRRALWVRDRGCRFPGCTNRRFTHGHHIRHWLHGGPTSLTNLVTLCTFHHQLLHEGGFGIKHGESDDLLFVDRYGTRIPDAGPALTAATSALTDVDDLDLSLCTWDGEPIDYDSVVDGLIVIGRTNVTPSLEA